MGPPLRLLLDTSVLLWITGRPERVSSSARAALDDRANELWISAASAWEIATKHRFGRLPQARGLTAGWERELGRFRFEQMPVTSAHALRAGAYDVTHADPFDRMIAAQAEIEQMAVVASDRAFDLFPVVRLW